MDSYLPDPLRTIYLEQIEAVWFLPLFLSPLFAIEVLLCSLLCSRETRALFGIALVTILVLSSLVLYQGNAPNRAIWVSPDGGMFLHKTLRPRAVIPYTAVVEVKAVALNPVDYEILNYLPSSPFLRWVTFQSPAMDIAGIVHEVNSSCDSIKVGDRVFGVTLGALQEYALAYCPTLGVIPNGVNFSQAVATPSGLCTALDGLGDFKAEDSILIVGASGGTGQGAIILAKARGSKKIYCISSKRNHDMVRSLGCTQVFNYDDPNMEETITNQLQGKIDYVWDAASAPLNSDYLKLLYGTLTPNGKYLGLLPILAAYTERGYEKFQMVMATPSHACMDYLSHHPELFKTRIVYEKNGLNVNEVRRAYELLMSRHAGGKVVLKINQ
jgi:D-arabinose 1-dehydrogenase-like Zn-dependent alcohol dehydrogenase